LRNLRSNSGNSKQNTTRNRRFDPWKIRGLCSLRVRSVPAARETCKDQRIAVRPQGLALRSAAEVAAPEDRAQLPSEGLEKFTKDIWQITQETIADVSSPDEAKKEVA
jgi:hypothetical protein